MNKEEIECTLKIIKYAEEQEWKNLYKYIINLQNNWNELKEYLKKIIEESGVPIRQYYGEHLLDIMQKIESRN